MMETSESVAWRKAIPEARDRLQSRVLVWIAVPVLCYLVSIGVWPLLTSGAIPRADLTKALAISLVFALGAWRLKAATPMAGFCGGIICLLVTESFQRVLYVLINRNGPAPSIAHSGLTPLFLLFALTFGATKVGSKHTKDSNPDEMRKGRNAAQIIANLGIAALMASLCGGDIVDLAAGGSGFSGSPESFARFTAIFLVPMLAALAEATADTVSSEIGQAFGGRPILITTLRRVAPGTDGAVSLLGTLAGIAAAALIAATGAPAMGMSFAECAVAFLAGVAGLFFDTLLGATLEYRGWIGNDLVNFFSTAFAAGISLVAIRYAQPILLR